MSCQGISASVAQHRPRGSRRRRRSAARAARAEHHVHLVRVQHVHDREQRADLDVARSASSSDSRRAPVLRRLAVLHEAGGDRPEAVARLDRAPAQQDAALVFRHAADDDLRILVVNRAAAVADVARQVIAGRRPECRRRGRIAEQNFIRVDVPSRGDAAQASVRIWCPGRESNAHDLATGRF